jgi:hypothetical protein
MTERSLSPSPLRPQHLERGAFSSFSALTHYKQSTEDKKQVQSSSNLPIRKAPLPKPKSPVRMRPQAQRSEKSPEPQSRSTLKPQASSRENLDPKPTHDIERLTDTIKTLTNHLEREKRIHLRIDAELKETRAVLKEEKEKVEKLQKSLQNALVNYSVLEKENQRGLVEGSMVKEALERMKENVQELASILVSVLKVFCTLPEEGLGVVGKEKIRVLERVKELVCEKLENIANCSKVDLSRQLGDVRGWMLIKGLRENSEKPKLFKEEPPEICYTVEYFEGSNKLKENTDSAVDEATLKNFCAEISFNEWKNAVALYDFEGETEDDLAFSRGDTIEIIEECQSGWWIGRLNGKTGSFPYNFVQVL